METTETHGGDAELLELTIYRQRFLLDPYTKFIKQHYSITNWEQLTCAGYNPYHQRLEAVVNIKRPNGYSGTLCTTASKEYVRFFVDFKDGAGFQDMGYSEFKVADISNAPAGPQHPLSYTSFLFIDDKKHRKFLDCAHAVIPTLRAVLSWNVVPSSNPDADPHYGNRLDVNIQLARKPFIFWKDFVDLSKIKEYAKLVDADFEIKLKEPYVENADVIHRVNLASQISSHRTLYATIGSKLNSTLDFSKAAAILDVANFDDLGVDLSSFYEFFNLEGKKADVSFEELGCVGLNSQTDRLGAIIHVKKQNGFSGNLCTKGSMEHVAFWADWNNNGTFDQYLGTVSLNVHDIANMPKDGLHYSVQLPIDVTNRLRTCSNPNIIRIRAVLSWESLPSTTNPNALNHWGNYKDALVQLRPAFRHGSDIYSAIHFVGGVDRTDIDLASHLYNAGPATPAHNRPWGGLITFGGIIDRNGFNGIVKYRFLVKKLSDPDVPASWSPCSTSETFELDDLSTPAGPFADSQTDPGGWFEFKQNPAGNLFYTSNYRGSWNATTMADGAYTIRFYHTDAFGMEVKADEFTIMVCNRGMHISMTANASVDFASDLDLVVDGGDCHNATSADPIIKGHLRAVHPYFAAWRLELQPSTHTHMAVPIPSTRSHSFIGDTGDANGVWELNTAPLDPCGYTISISADSRVILNSYPGDFPTYAPKAVGFAKLA